MLRRQLRPGTGAETRLPRVTLPAKEPGRYKKGDPEITRFDDKERRHKLKCIFVIAQEIVFRFHDKFSNPWKCKPA